MDYLVDIFQLYFKKLSGLNQYNFARFFHNEKLICMFVVLLTCLKWNNKRKDYLRGENIHVCKIIPLFLITPDCHHNFTITNLKMRKYNVEKVSFKLDVTMLEKKIKM